MSCRKFSQLVDLDIVNLLLSLGCVDMFDMLYDFWKAEMNCSNGFQNDFHFRTCLLTHPPLDDPMRLCSGHLIEVHLTPLYIFRFYVHRTRLKGNCYIWTVSKTDENLIPDRFFSQPLVRLVVRRRKKAQN